MRILAAILLGLGLMIAGCGGGDKPADTKPAEKPADKPANP